MLRCHFSFWRRSGSAYSYVDTLSIRAPSPPSGYTNTVPYSDCTIQWLHCTIQWLYVTLYSVAQRYILGLEVTVLTKNFSAEVQNANNMFLVFSGWQFLSLYCIYCSDEIFCAFAQRLNGDVTTNKKGFFQRVFNDLQRTRLFCGRMIRPSPTHSRQ